MPKTPTDLGLAPVAVGIDTNLQRLRDADPEHLLEEVVLTLNTEPGEHRDARMKQILEIATRGVDMHGWTAAISGDATRLQLRGGSVPLDLGLSERIRGYIEFGV